MFLSDSPCLSLAIAPLTAAEPNHYAIWVLQAPNPSAYGHHDRIWSPSMTQIWHNWHSMFSARGLPEVPRVFLDDIVTPPPVEDPPTAGFGQEVGMAGRLMQNLGLSLWQWLFDGSIESSFDQSQGIAIGRGKPLRLRLEVRDPNLTAVPWEIMQSQPGKQAVSLSQQLLFSRTTSAVDPLPRLRTEQFLRILLVLGHDVDSLPGVLRSGHDPSLQLKQEAEALTQILRSATEAEADVSFPPPVLCEVKALVQPTAAELISELETEKYNVLFYSGHGVPAPDGGLLFLRSDATINGTELAQVLTRCQVKLAVFNACWGAQPDHQGGQATPRSSLAEVLIHHGVPAVLGMRDSIADHEALSFIQVFARSLAERLPIDEAVAIARQHLLMLYKFNQPAWTLPVLYMHPEFNGELIRPITEGVTEIPENSPSWISHSTPTAYLRSLTLPEQTWHIRGGIMRVGNMEGNDLILRGPGISRRHAEIFYRDSAIGGDGESTYVLRDFSRYGTLAMGPNGWYRVHQREVPLSSQTRLKFGSVQLEFVIDGCE